MFVSQERLLGAQKLLSAGASKTLLNQGGYDAGTLALMSKGLSKNGQHREIATLLGVATEEVQSDIESPTAPEIGNLETQFSTERMDEIGGDLLLEITHSIQKREQLLHQRKQQG